MLRPTAILRLPAAVRPLRVSNCDPLRVLFCGSDAFSIASLKKLLQAKHDAPSLIESIDVVHRPGKATGRGLKKITQVPIQKVASEELQLPTHVIDTFTGWTPPIPYNLVIAVSFGILVPPRILDLAKYKGLNVHPSLLPDLSGPAPLHHTILKKRPFAGVTVQTLHPDQFDGGTILAQSPKPGIEYSRDATLADLTELLGEKGGDMLVDVLKAGAFAHPVKDVGWYADSSQPVEHAEKLEKRHWFIDFAKHTLDDITTMRKAGGLPWTRLPDDRRLVLNHCTPTALTTTEETNLGIWCPDLKHPFANHKATPKRCLMAKTADGGILQIQTSTAEGGRMDGGYEGFKNLVGQKHVNLWEKGEEEPRDGKEQMAPR